MSTGKQNRRWRLDWPLLGKELLEQAARKQMYVVRVAYALVLFGAFCLYYQQHLAEGSVQALGRGLGPFRFLVFAQLVAIYLFLPPLMAGAVAREKERDTLGLLFLTDLTPWQLILQKYVGRLIPMLTLLFLSLPLLAIAYSLGGVSADMLYSSAATLFLTCLWVGALALECSAHQATTFQALIRSWGFCLGMVLCCWMSPIALVLPLAGEPESPFFLAFSVLFAASGCLLVTLLFLLRAKQILLARAFVQRRNPFGHQFRQMDRYWKDLRKLLRALTRQHDREAYMDAEQVIRRGLAASRDKRPWTLGRFLLARMQIPNLLAFAIIFGFIVLIALATSVFIDPKSGGAFVVVVSGLWLLALLTVPIQSANAVASERMNGRLDVMLTTPLTARAMLDEWLGPVRRWIHFLIRPLMVVFVIEAIVESRTQGEANRWRYPALYLAVSLLAVWIYPFLVQWLCLWIGLRIRNQLRAMMTALVLVVAWCVLPLIAASYLDQTGLLPTDWAESLKFVSPVAVINTAEAFGKTATNGDVTSSMIGMAFVHLGLAAMLLAMVRRICLTHADRYLGRI